MKIMSYPAILFAWLVFTTTSSEAQVYGCTDPQAVNYNPSATVNNGSCTYNTTNYAPPILVDPISDSLQLTSGLQMAGNFLWSFNGHSPVAIFRIDTTSRAVFQIVYLEGATNIDWEEISFDGGYFYVGDFGNNATGARTDLKIYKFPFSAIPSDYVANPSVTIPASQIQVINFTYSDQPQPPVATGSNNTKFDCEAMIIDGGKIHLFTKNWIDVNTTHYVINSLAAGTYVATPLDTLATNYLVTASSKSVNGVVALLGYQTVIPGNHFIHLLSDYSGGKYFNGNKRRIDLPNAAIMGQSEGITFRNGTYGYISNTKLVAGTPPLVLKVSQKLRSFEVSGFIPPAFVPVTYIFTGNGNWNVSSNWSNNTVPPASLVGGSQIIVDTVPGGQCILNVPYTLSSGSVLTVKPGKIFMVPGNLTLQ